MKKKVYPFVIALMLGAVMIVIGFIIKDETLKVLSGMLIGVGAGLVGMSSSQVLLRRFENNNPDIFKRSEIEQKDERNIAIRNKSKAASADITKWCIFALALLMIVTDAPLWLTLSALGVFLLYHILALVFMVRYQKQM